MASIWRRSRNSRCWSSSPSRTSLAIFVGQLELGQGLLGPAEHQAHPRLDVDGLEQLDLALERQLGPPAGEVGQRAGVVAGDGAEDAVDLPAAEVLEQRPQRGPQLDAEARAPRR